MKIATSRSQRHHFSPLRYPGGKSFLFPFLDKLLQQASISKAVYVEPFAGGAGAALALLFSDRVQEIVINDLDHAIYSFWKSAVDETDRFVQQIHMSPISVTEWKRQRDIYHSPRPTRFALGFATFYLNRTNRSGFLGGGPIGGLKQAGEWKIDARYNKDALAARVEKLRAYRSRIAVTQEDGAKLLNKYLKQKRAFIYLDPPYYDKGSTLYLNHYEHDDHMSLAKKLNANARANWVLTYDNNPTIRELYRTRTKMSFSLNYNAYESRRGKEVLIMSDTLSKCAT